MCILTRSAKSKEIFDEIIQTEKFYNESLQLINKYFYEPLWFSLKVKTKLDINNNNNNNQPTSNRINNNNNNSNQQHQHHHNHHQQQQEIMFV
eukprot:Awhi_evm1s7135